MSLATRTLLVKYAYKAGAIGRYKDSNLNRVQRLRKRGCRSLSILYELVFSLLQAPREGTSKDVQILVPLTGLNSCR